MFFFCPMPLRFVVELTAVVLFPVICGCGLHSIEQIFWFCVRDSSPACGDSHSFSSVPPLLTPTQAYAVWAFDKRHEVKLELRIYIYHMGFKKNTHTSALSLSLTLTRTHRYNFIQCSPFIPSSHEISVDFPIPYCTKIWIYSLLSLLFSLPLFLTLSLSLFSPTLSLTDIRTKSNMNKCNSSSSNTSTDNRKAAPGIQTPS